MGSMKWRLQTVHQQLKSCATLHIPCGRPTANASRERLRAGNPRPSPGPDAWEKWALVRCAEPFLELIANLCNYTITTNYFPDRLKENYLVPLYKRGDTTNPSNYRGIVLANCLYQLISAWFGHCLQQYVWRKGLLSPTQVATQKGVQPADIVSFLDQLHTAAAATQTTVFAIKRDHTKGFDFLHSSAFLDALRFFGLGEAAIAFETARTDRCTLRVKSQDGVATEVIITVGQTKQGEHISPLKYTLTMSMLSRWLATLPQVTAATPAIKSVSAANGNPHTAAEQQPVRVTAVEATDDSILMALSWALLQTTLQFVEKFQTAYGVTTAWDSPDKTVCFTLGKPPPDPLPAHVTFRIDDKEIDVPTTDCPRFLRAALKDPSDMFQSIKAIITAFPLPVDKWCPISLYRRAVQQLLMPKIRGRLAARPVSRTQAQALDS
ncbi:hypothetical protein A1Q2_07156 [Trichosporon asahii var. asahii CBS 8904]|uniref:Uncharacterized protein n=1 Tax=Trichosporon asahii var. asahii (strain CBS 8904) TaxID=1220162 RepID=K1VCQ9_TRIAC|nr:hypothetical protein A1Q2_07156 [Trichosporon asahii var. asahii CBS 8904]